MKCIFYKRESSSSVSVEHIIPESLGNTKFVLPKGVVCDGCNNYFAREVEKPFLEHESIRLLRFEGGIIRKKGKVPHADGVVLGGGKVYPITLHRKSKDGGRIESFDFNCLDIGDDAQILLNQIGSQGQIVVPRFDVDMLPVGSIVSRFLAKVALEVMVYKLIEITGWDEAIVDNEQLDELRNHARLGSTRDWPVSIRSIYNKNTPMINNDTNELIQIVHEFDILTTKDSEHYLVLALFGVEFAINLGGAEIENYFIWLDEHDGQSPLYVDKIIK